MANPELTHRPSSLDRKAQRLAKAMQPRSPRRPSAAIRLGRALGWFGIGLGVLELVAARPLARALGLQGHASLLQVFGMREIVNGIGILGASTPGPMSHWMHGRVAGDALDLAALAAATARPNPPHASPVAALGAVVGVAALDLACARALAHEAQASRIDVDYSDRAGIPAPPEQMRGAALSTFTQPDDMRVSAHRLVSTAIH